MIITFTVAVEVKFAGGGPFASRGDITEQLREAMNEANPETLEGETGGSYEVVSWEVTAL